MPHTCNSWSKGTAVSDTTLSDDDVQQLAKGYWYHARCDCSAAHAEEMMHHTYVLYTRKVMTSHEWITSETQYCCILIYQLCWPCFLFDAFVWTCAMSCIAKASHLSQVLQYCEYNKCLKDVHSDCCPGCTFRHLLIIASLVMLAEHAALGFR